MPLAQLCGLTTVLVRPPAILGTGETSVWNTLRPQEVRDGDRRANPAKIWPWAHVDDLAALIADVATGVVATADDPKQGPVARGTTTVIVAWEPATWWDYHGTVTDALGVEPEWTDEPVWTGQLRTERAGGAGGYASASRRRWTSCGRGSRHARDRPAGSRPPVHRTPERPTECSVGPLHPVSEGRHATYAHGC